MTRSGACIIDNLPLIFISKSTVPYLSKCSFCWSYGFSVKVFHLYVIICYKKYAWFDINIKIELVNFSFYDKDWTWRSQTEGPRSKNVFSYRIVFLPLWHRFDELKCVEFGTNCSEYYRVSLNRVYQHQRGSTACLAARYWDQF